MRLGVLGGSFDPVHHGHLRIAEAARDTFDLERIIVVPNFQNPLKSATYTSSHHRFAMLALAFSHINEAIISDIEVTSNQPCFTYNTLSCLANDYPESELFFIAGADSMAEFEKWFRWKDILDLCSIIIVNRKGIDTGRTRYRKLDIDLPFSSTEVRSMLKNEKSIKGMVPEEVRNYITRHGLYGAK